MQIRSGSVAFRRSIIVVAHVHLAAFFVIVVVVVFIHRRLFVAVIFSLALGALWTSYVLGILRWWLESCSATIGVCR